jgi:hypothetical protein
MAPHADLRARVAAEHAGLTLAALDRPALALLSRERGVDHASALLDALLRREERNAALIAAVDRAAPRRPRGVRVLIAPAAGYVERPEYGGDGRVAQEAAEGLGLERGVVPLESLGSIAVNVDILRSVLSAEPEDSVILVSLSKGSAEVRLALEDPRARRSVRGWLNVSGLLRGTPLTDYRPGNRLAYLWGRSLMLLKGVPTAFLNDLGHESAILAGPYTELKGVRVANLIGLPLREHLSGRVASRHRDLARWGPNDGYGLTLDAMHPAGPTYPAWGANHYFQVPGLEAVLAGLLSWLGTTPRHE